LGVFLLNAKNYRIWRKIGNKFARDAQDYIPLRIPSG
jgi:hypothetical protein